MSEVSARSLRPEEPDQLVVLRVLAPADEVDEGLVRLRAELDGAAVVEPHGTGALLFRAEGANVRVPCRTFRIRTTAGEQRDVRHLVRAAFSRVDVMRDRAYHASAEQREALGLEALPPPGEGPQAVR